MIILLAAAALAIQPAATPSWRDWGVWDDGAVGTWDANSVGHDGDEARVWVQFDFSKTPPGTEPEHIRLSHVSIGCAAERVRVTYSISYDEAGTLVHIDDAPTDWAPIDPGSHFASLRSYVCGGAEGPARPSAPR